MTVSNSKSDKRAELEDLINKSEGLRKEIVIGAIWAWHEQEIAETLEHLRHNLEADLFGHDYKRLVDEINNITEALKEQTK